MVKTIHGYFIRKLFYRFMEETRHLGTSILNMYIRCRNISSATVCFNNILVKDLVTWTTMSGAFQYPCTCRDIILHQCKMLERNRRKLGMKILQQVLNFSFKFRMRFKKSSAGNSPRFLGILGRALGMALVAYSRKFSLFKAY